MKSTLTIISGYIAAIGAVGWLIFLIWIFADKPLHNRYLHEILLWLSGFIPVVSITVYLIKTEFWKSNPSDIEVIEMENQLIKKQIEQKELKIKLNDLGGN
jgi:hypothetical protein